MAACALVLALAATPSPTPPPTSRRNALLSLAADELLPRTGMTSWDAPLGKAVLHLATVLLLRPAFITISEAVRGVDLIPVEPKIDLEGGMLARSIDANLTRLRIDGLHSLSPFPSLTASGTELVAASSSFENIDAEALLSARLHGPFGHYTSQKLKLRASLSNVSLDITWRCCLRKDIKVSQVVSAVAASNPLGNNDLSSALDIGVANVTVRCDDVVVQVESAEGEDEAEEQLGSIAPVWRLLSRAFSTLLKALVEEHAATAVREGLEAALEELGL